MDGSLNLVLQECARQFGASVPEAAAFAHGDLLTVDDTPVAIGWTQTPDALRTVMATAHVERPPRIDEVLWFSLLLQVNAQTMAAAPMGFHLQSGHCMLVARMQPDQLQDPRLLAAELRGMSAICRSLRSGLPDPA